jgi:YesN/AraC family two-component response regulator
LRQKARRRAPGSEDELDEYSKNVQSRIKRLTEKYRKEERDREEAVRLSQQLLEENKKLKSRMQQLDTGYLSEYGTRLQTQTEAAKRAYKRPTRPAILTRMADAQMAMSNLAIEQQRYNNAKARLNRTSVCRPSAHSASQQFLSAAAPGRSRPSPTPRLRAGPRRTRGLARTGS